MDKQDLKEVANFFLVIMAISYFLAAICCVETIESAGFFIWLRATLVIGTTTGILFFLGCVAVGIIFAVRDDYKEKRKEKVKGE